MSGLGCFQDLAMAIFALSNMKCTNFCVDLSRRGAWAFRRAVLGVPVIRCPVTLEIILKIILQKERILGHSHYMCAMVPRSRHPRKQRGSAEGNMEANLEGVRYHLVKTFTLASIREAL